MRVQDITIIGGRFFQFVYTLWNWHQIWEKKITSVTSVGKLPITKPRKLLYILRTIYGLISRSRPTVTIPG